MMACPFCRGDHDLSACNPKPLPKLDLKCCRCGVPTEKVGICVTCWAHEEGEQETLKAIVAEVTARRDRAAKHRHAPYGDGCDECGREKALDDLLDWLSDWKRGG